MSDTPAKQAQLSITDRAGKTLTVNRMQLVIRSIELEASDAAECEDNGTEDGCEETERGPDAPGSLVLKVSPLVQLTPFYIPITHSLVEMPRTLAAIVPTP